MYLEHTLIFGEFKGPIGESETGYPAVDRALRSTVLQGGR